MCVCVRKKKLLLLQVLYCCHGYCHFFSTVLRLGMQLINGWKGEIRYEEGAATGMHNDVSGKGKGFWV